ncbi:Endonuclease/exonuclease/phosphatase [Blastocladiella britannica]|nr:Endonuclease/exonuclease/phosphatase [Blastocladiella britannica]
MSSSHASSTLAAPAPETSAPADLQEPPQSKDNLHVMVLTFNVARNPDATRAELTGLLRAVAKDCPTATHPPPDLIAINLQEGGPAASLAVVDVAAEMAWIDAMAGAIAHAAADAGWPTYLPLSGSPCVRQAGLLLAIFTRDAARTRGSAVARVATGAPFAIMPNKGAVGVSVAVGPRHGSRGPTRSIAVMNVHLPHGDDLAPRLAAWDAVMARTVFVTPAPVLSGPSSYRGNRGEDATSVDALSSTSVVSLDDDGAPAAPLLPTGMRGGPLTTARSAASAAAPPSQSSTMDTDPTTLADHVAVVLAGDLNFRLALPGPAAHRAAATVPSPIADMLAYDTLARAGQLPASPAAGWREGPIGFPPTYKVLVPGATAATGVPTAAGTTVQPVGYIAADDGSGMSCPVGTPTDRQSHQQQHHHHRPPVYDSTRIPGFTDRILFRSCRESTSVSCLRYQALLSTAASTSGSDHVPVVALLCMQFDALPDLTPPASDRGGADRSWPPLVDESWVWRSRWTGGILWVAEHPRRFAVIGAAVIAGLVAAVLVVAWFVFGG